MAETAPDNKEDLIVHQKGRHGDPLNAEPEIDSLTSSYITPLPRLFHRNHDDIVYEPKTEGVYSEWRVSLSVDEDVAQEQRWSKWQERSTLSLPVLDLIQGRGSCRQLQHLDTTATIECAGNRREELAEGQKAEGIQWGPGVIANIYWSGASVRSLLMVHGIPDPYSHHDNLAVLIPSDAGITEDCAPWAQSLHLHLLSAQPTSESERPGGEFFGASIPLSTALHPNQRCILAHLHNGKTLEQAHGFPIRAVIPGHAGARWVKWLNGLRISKDENESPPMQLDYKVLTPPKDAGKDETEEWKGKIMGEDKDVAFRRKQLDQEEAMQRLGMGSAIDLPQDNGTIQGAAIKAKGYAVGQDGSPVSSMECIVLEQQTASESSSSLRNRAEASAASQWTRAEIQSSAGAGQGTDKDAPLNWAWTLWEAQVPLPDSSGSHESRYALVARASEFTQGTSCRHRLSAERDASGVPPMTATASGNVQEKESPWNVRGFQTRSWPVIRGLQRAQ